MMRAGHCCDDMRRDIESDDRVIHRYPNGVYGIILHDSELATLPINFCPWCGSNINYPDGA